LNQENGLLASGDCPALPDKPPLDEGIREVLPKY